MVRYTPKKWIFLYDNYVEKKNPTKCVQEGFTKSIFIFKFWLQQQFLDR
jgi:hypothetical protein